MTEELMRAIIIDQTVEVLKTVFFIGFIVIISLQIFKYLPKGVISIDKKRKCLKLLLLFSIAFFIERILNGAPYGLLDSIDIVIQIGYILLIKELALLLVDLDQSIRSYYLETNNKKRLLQWHKVYLVATDFKDIVKYSFIILVIFTIFNFPIFF